MVGAHADVVRAGLFEDARGELVAGKRLHFVGLGDGVLAFGVLLQLAAVDAEEADVGGDVVAVHQFDLKEDELGTGRVEFEAVPVLAGEGGDGVLAGGTGKRQVLEFIAGGGDELAERDGRGMLPGVVGSGGEGPAIDLQMVAGRAFRRDTFHDDAQLGGAGGTEEAVQVGVAGMEGLGEQDAGAFDDRHRDASGRAEVAGRVEAEEQAVANGGREFVQLRRLGADFSGRGIYGRQGEVRGLGQANGGRDEEEKRTAVTQHGGTLLHHMTSAGGVGWGRVDSLKRLPGERRQVRDCREVPVASRQRQIELAGHGGYPNVVVRDQRAGLGKLRLYYAVLFAGVLVW